VADDHLAMLAKVAGLVGDVCQIVGRVGDGKAALNETLRLRPDIVLMDISMPIMNGIDAAEILIHMRVAAKIIFLTVHDDPDFVRAALATGVAGYVIKSHIATDLLPAIDEALAGHRFVSPCLRRPELSTP
jgi:DNA-binding NarL/FixJ family response regulator